MEKLEKGHKLSQSPDFVAQNIELLKSLFPQLNKEGKIDKQELLALLSDYTETDEEFYRFTWAGKSMARREANKPSTATLLPDKESSKEWDTTQNVFIEGDNLEVLKLLQKGYANKIKMIYIDPPYNTGKDFVYKDNYSDNLNNYLAITGQLGEDGKRISTNSESNGRYHSNWLNMMYPRLKLARNLLKEDGVIFISIDDNEQANLKKLCDEVFGEENFISDIIWERSYAPINMVKHFSKSHDYILSYAKNILYLECYGLERPASTNSKYGNPDNDPRGEWRTDNLSVGPVIESKVYEIITPSGRKCLPPKGRCWLYTKERYEEMVSDNRIWFGEDGNNIPAPKRFLSEVKQGLTPMTIWKYSEVGHTQDSMRELRELFEGEKVFDYSKPVRLLERIYRLYSSENDIILDFFAGSGTTAHAVMQLNAEDGGERKFICVQLPEPTDKKSEAYKAGYKTISEITKERIRRAGEKIKAELKEDLFTDQGKTLDIGFKAFKLDSSNIRAWDGNPEALEENLFTAENNIKENRTEEDVLYEILLKYGLDLTIPYEEKTLEGQRVFNLGMGALFVCLGTKITTEVAEGIGQWYEELQVERTKVILRDNGFTDVAKTNSMKILERYGIKEVSTI